MVQCAKIAGATNEYIASQLDISADTLAKYYGQEIEHGKEHLLTMVAGKLIQAAMSGCATRQIFFLKTQGCWSERKEQGESDKRELPKVVIEIIPPDDSPDD